MLPLGKGEVEGDGESEELGVRSLKYHNPLPTSPFQGAAMRSDCKSARTGIPELLNMDEG